MRAISVQNVAEMEFEVHSSGLFRLYGTSGTPGSGSGFQRFGVSRVPGLVPFKVPG